MGNMDGIFQKNRNPTRRIRTPDIQLRRDNHIHAVDHQLLHQAGSLRRNRRNSFHRIGLRPLPDLLDLQPAAYGINWQQTGAGSMTAHTSFRAIHTLTTRPLGRENKLGRKSVGNRTHLRLERLAFRSGNDNALRKIRPGIQDVEQMEQQRTAHAHRHAHTFSTSATISNGDTRNAARANSPTPTPAWKHPKQEDDSLPLRNLPGTQKKLKTGSDFEKPKKNSNFAALNLQRTGLVAQLDRATAF